MFGFPLTPLFFKVTKNGGIAPLRQPFFFCLFCFVVVFFFLKKKQKQTNFILFTYKPNCRNVVGENSINHKRHDSTEFWPQGKSGFFKFHILIFEFCSSMKYFQRLIRRYLKTLVCGPACIWTRDLPFCTEAILSNATSWQHNFPFDRYHPKLSMISSRGAFNCCYRQCVKVTRDLRSHSRVKLGLVTNIFDKGLQRSYMVGSARFLLRMEWIR